MPPLRLLSPFYLLLGLLLFAGGTLIVYSDKVFAKETGTAPILAAGVAVTIISLLCTMWMQWRSARTQHTLSALLSLRSDKEYLIAARKVSEHMPREVLPEDWAAHLPDRRVVTWPPKGASDGEFKPTFQQSVDYVLNQYEFFAAATRAGTMDEELLRETIQGVVCTMVERFAPYIARERHKSARTWRNLIWLYLRFTDRRGLDAMPDVGPLPPVPRWPV